MQDEQDSDFFILQILLILLILLILSKLFILSSLIQKELSLT